MKKEKLNLKSIKKVLSRTELKTIMAGSSSGPGPGGGGCTPYIIPAAVFACHDSSGYVVGHATTNCCSHTAGALQACNNVTYPTVTYSVTGPC